MFLNRARSTSSYCLLALVACSAPAEAPLPQVTGVLPALEARSLPNLPDDLIRAEGSRIAISVTGHLAAVSPPRPDDNFLIQVIDSTGAVVSRLGPRGRGPGELQLVGFLAFSGDSLLGAHDATTARLSLFNLEGRLVFPLPLDVREVPLTLGGDSIDIRVFGGSDNRWLRRSLRGSGARPLLVSSDSAFAASFPDRGTPERPVVVARAYASTPDRIAIGSQDEYRILLYSSRGQFIGQILRDVPRQLPSSHSLRMVALSLEGQPMLSPARRAAMVKEFSERPQMHFRQLRFDGMGRLWVLGPDGEDGYADVYADTTFLGRLKLPCPGFTGDGWDLAGAWLGVTCADTREDAASYGTVRVFRILETGPVP